MGLMQISLSAMLLKHTQSDKETNDEIKIELNKNTHSTLVGSTHTSEQSTVSK